MIRSIRPGVRKRPGIWLSTSISLLSTAASTISSVNRCSGSHSMADTMLLCRIQFLFKVGRTDDSHKAAPPVDIEYPGFPFGEFLKSLPVLRCIYLSSRTWLFTYTVIGFMLSWEGVSSTKSGCSQYSPLSMTCHLPLSNRRHVSSMRPKMSALSAMRDADCRGVSRPSRIFEKQWTVSPVPVHFP